MNTLIFSLWTLCYFSSIYDISIPGINGGPDIHFSDYSGKRIFIVNIASGSPFATQFIRLEELYQQNKDSLVIVAIPSDDFGHEPGDEQTIQQVMQNTYHIHFVIAGKLHVTENNQSQLYSWLTHHSESGAMSSTVNGDFQKYLISQDGHLMGYFTGSMDPLDATIQDAIHAQ